MNADDVGIATVEAAATAKQLVGHLRRLADRTAHSVPAQADGIEFWPDERREAFYALTRMVEQLQNLTSRQILRGILMLLGEDPAGLSARNLFRRLETLGALPSADRWLELASIRNTLVHEYPTNARRQVDQIRLAHGVVAELTRTVDAILAFLDRELPPRP